MHKALLLIALSLTGSDAYTTQRLIGINSTERNPLARPFVLAGPVPRAGYFAGSAGTFLLVDHKLQHHRKLRIIWDIGWVGLESYSTGNNMRLMR